MKPGPNLERVSPSPAAQSRTEWSSQEQAAAPFAARIGSTIGGKYRVERVIGAGAMGVVLAARHIQLDETVALKFIQPEMQKVPGVLSRFAREAKACVRIKSDHIANVLDVGVSEELGPYIVMEYLEGRDLAALLSETGPMRLQRACEYVMQACEALALAHSLSITHRDIKPSNLFVTRRGNLEIVKLLDFGISKASLTGGVFGADLALVQTTSTMGTPLYMSPEQIRATNTVDHRSDIWSLGVVLYELITGQTAFVADSLMQVCALVLESNPAPLRERCAGTPTALQAVIDRCLDKDPEQRFQSVAELAAALAPFAPARARVHADRASSVLQSPSPTSSGDAAPPLQHALEAETQLAGGSTRTRYVKYAPLAGIWIGIGLIAAAVQLLVLPRFASQPESDAAAAAPAVASAALPGSSHATNADVKPHSPSLAALDVQSQSSGQALPAAVLPAALPEKAAAPSATEKRRAANQERAARLRERRATSRAASKRALDPAVAQDRSKGGTPPARVSAPRREQPSGAPETVGSRNRARLVEPDRRVNLLQ